MREKKSNFLSKTMLHPFWYARVNDLDALPNICISQLLCYYCSSWRRLGVFAFAQFDIFVVKVGSTCESETDLDEKRVFHYKLSEKFSEAHRNISIFKIPLYNSNS